MRKFKENFVIHARDFKVSYYVQKKIIKHNFMVQTNIKLRISYFIECISNKYN